jgi:TonB family protein
VPLTEHPRAFAASAAKPSHNFPAPKSTVGYGDKVDVPQRQVSSKPAVERRSATRSNSEDTTGARTLVLDASAPEEVLSSDEIVPHLRAIFRHSDVVAEEPSSNKKRTAIIAVSACTLLLVAFQLFHSGAIGKLTGMASKQPVATKVKMDLDRNAALANANLGLQGSNTAAGQAANQSAANKPAAGVPGDTADNGSLPTNQKQTTPAPEQAQMMHDQLLAPTRIPEGSRGSQSGDAPPPSGLAGIDALNGSSMPGTMFKGQAQPTVKAAAPKVVNVSADVAVAMLVQKTAPVYPQIAKSAHIGGTVTLQATITKTGAVTNLRVLNGPTVLRQSAVDAVKTWRYRPYTYDNQPTEANTTINVVFSPGN